MNATKKAKLTHSPQVVTWADGSGNSLDICQSCQERLEAEGTWPKSGTGVEYCQVSHGLHRGFCGIETVDSPGMS
jgi:hypothetical protein